MYMRGDETYQRKYFTRYRELLLNCTMQMNFREHYFVSINHIWCLSLVLLIQLCTCTAIKCVDNSTSSVRINKGVVETYFLKKWGTICANSGWDNKDASVICKMLNLGTTGRAHKQSGKTFLPVVYSNVRCSGTERDIGSCPKHRIIGSNARYNSCDRASVTCNKWPPMPCSRNQNNRPCLCIDCKNVSLSIALHYRCNSLNLGPSVPRLTIASDPVNLDLSSNNIEIVQIGDFSNLKDVQSLNMRNNQIKSIGTGAFLDYGLITSLKKLDLSMNELRSVPSSIGELNNLISLNISHNHFRSIHKNLTKLNIEMLDISHNHIATNQSIFDKMQHLAYLNMSYNGIQRVGQNAFNGLHRLISLDLSANRIATVDSSAFIDCRMLLEILLSNNRLSMVPMLALRNIPILKRLDLSHNKISAIIPESFKSLKINHLDLSGNNIFRLFPYAFSGLTVNSIDISGNPLNEIPYCAFLETTPIYNSGVILVTFNVSLSCNCKLGWLKEKYKGQLFGNSKCTAPLFGVSVKSILDTLEDCSDSCQNNTIITTQTTKDLVRKHTTPPKSVMLTVSIVLGVLVLLLITVVIVVVYKLVKKRRQVPQQQQQQQLRHQPNRYLTVSTTSDGMQPAPAEDVDGYMSLSQPTDTNVYDELRVSDNYHLEPLKTFHAVKD